MDVTLLPILMITAPITLLGLTIFITWLCLPQQHSHQPVNYELPRTSIRSSWGNLGPLPPIVSDPEDAMEMSIRRPESAMIQMV